MKNYLISFLLFIGVISGFSQGNSYFGKFTGNGAGLTNLSFPNAITNGQTNVTLSGTITGNGAGLTNLNGNFAATAPFTNVIPNTNIITLVGFGSTGANQTYVWSSGSAAYVGQIASTWTLDFNGPGSALEILNSGTVYYNSFIYSPLRSTYYLTNDFSNNRVAGILPLGGGSIPFQTLIMNSMPNGVNALYGNFGLGNNLTTNYPSYPSFVSGLYNSEYGFDSVILGGTHNTNYDSGDFIGGCVAVTIQVSGGEDTALATENSLMNNLNGVEAMIACITSTNFANQEGAMIGCTTSMTDTNGYFHVMLAGYYSYQNSQQVITGGRQNTNIATNSVSLGNFTKVLNGFGVYTYGDSNNVSGGNEVYTFGTGFNSTNETGVSYVGVPGASLRQSGGSNTFTGNVVLPSTNSLQIKSILSAPALATDANGNVISTTLGIPTTLSVTNLTIVSNLTLIGTSSSAAPLCGIATLGNSTPGAVQIYTTAIQTNSLVFITYRSSNIGVLAYFPPYVANIVAGTSFQINSTLSDTSSVNWLIVNNQ